MNLLEEEARQAWNPPVPQSGSTPTFRIKRCVHFEAVDMLSGEHVPLPKNVVIRRRITWLIILKNTIFAKAKTRKMAFQIAEDAFAEALEGKHGTL